MYHRQEDELDLTNWGETESMVMVPGDASVDFLAPKLNTKEKGDDATQNQDSRIRFSRYCDREFKSDKAFGGHRRIHSQYLAKSKARIHRMKSTKLARKYSPEEDDDGFTCFVCDDSFSSMKLLCQHMRHHRETDSNGIQQPIPSQESHSLSEPETTVEEGNDTVSRRNDQNQRSCINLLKDLPNWSQTGKRGREETVSDKIDDKIYNALPLRVYYGSAVPLTERRLEDSQNSNQSLLTRKKQKIEETIPMDSQSDSESTVELLGNSKQTTTNKISMIHQGSHGRLKNPKRAKAVKSVHQCEICGKTFQTGPALGGHKTYHRVKPKPVVNPFRVKLVQRKAKKQSSGETGRDYITRMLLPMELSREANSAEESYQEHPKRLLDFDLNIPYEG